MKPQMISKMMKWRMNKKIMPRLMRCGIDVDDEIEDIEEELIDETQVDDIDEENEEEDEEDHTDTMIVRTNSEIMEQLLDIIDEQDKSLANAFGDLDDDGNRMLSADELVTKLNEILPEGLSQEEDNLINQWIQMAMATLTWLNS